MEDLQKISQLFEPQSPPGNGYLVDFPVLYINLDKSPQRNEFMLAQQKHLRISKVFERVEAIDGNEIDREKDFPFEVVNKMNDNEAACTLSHLAAIRKARDAGWDRVLILEDDASFELFPYLEHQLNDYLDALPEDWQFLSLHHSGEKVPFEGFDSLENPDDLVFSEQCWSCVAYIVNRSGMEKALRDRTLEGPVLWGQADYLVYDKCAKYTLKLPIILDRDKARSELNSILRPPQADYAVAQRVIGFYRHLIHQPIIEKVFRISNEKRLQELDSLGNIHHEPISSREDLSHHYAIWQKIVAHEKIEQRRIDQIPYIKKSVFTVNHDRDLFLVLAEGAVVPETFLHQFSELSGDLRFDFDMIRLDSNVAGPGDSEPGAGVFEKSRLKHDIQAYFLTVSGAQKLLTTAFLEGFVSFKAFMDADLHKNLRVFQVEPGLVATKSPPY